ncbi:MAG: prealbumin-like fold domain-containing protein, partial [Oscillospiraceae bacterium]|nr:prealbumin-like fold domain-containing protein [Oscillospiraceae bacterium]
MIAICFSIIAGFASCALPPVDNEVDAAAVDTTAPRARIAAVGTSQVEISVFMRDPNGNALSNASFSLYAASLPDYTSPLQRTAQPRTAVVLPILGTDGVSRNFYQLVESVTTDVSGAAVLSNPLIDTAYDFLFLLVETAAPEGYTWNTPNTFFTVNPDISPELLSEIAVIFGQDIGQVSDSITITNVPTTPEPPPTATPTPSPSPTPTASPSPSPTPTASPSPSPTASPSPSPAPTASPSPSPTMAPAPTERPSPTPTAAPTATPTPLPPADSTPSGGSGQTIILVVLI